MLRPVTAAPQDGLAHGHPGGPTSRADARTAPLGAVLLTGYLGGAFCAQLRIDAPVASTLLFPVYVGVAVWAGLWLRDQRVRDLLAPRA